jgi:hypothetical protein
MRTVNSTPQSTNHIEGTRKQTPTIGGKGYHCEVIVYDTILAFDKQVYMCKTTNVEDAQFHLGLYIHSQDFVKGTASTSNEWKQITKPLCSLWRYEMILLMERLRWCYLLSKYCDIERPMEWGTVTNAHNKLIASREFCTHLFPVIDRRKKSMSSKSNSMYVKECGIRKNCEPGC